MNPRKRQREDAQQTHGAALCVCMCVCAWVYARQPPNAMVPSNAQSRPQPVPPLHRCAGPGAMSPVWGGETLHTYSGARKTPLVTPPHARRMWSAASVVTGRSSASGRHSAGCVPCAVSTCGGGERGVHVCGLYGSIGACPTVLPTTHWNVDAWKTVHATLFVFGGMCAVMSQWGGSDAGPTWDSLVDLAQLGLIGSSAWGICAAFDAQRAGASGGGRCTRPTRRRSTFVSTASVECSTVVVDDTQSPQELRGVRHAPPARAVPQLEIEPPGQSESSTDDLHFGASPPSAHKAATGTIVDSDSSMEVPERSRRFTHEGHAVRTVATSGHGAVKRPRSAEQSCQDPDWAAAEHGGAKVPRRDADTPSPLHGETVL